MADEQACADVTGEGGLDGVAAGTGGGDDGGDGDAGWAVEKLADGEGERGEGGERRSLGGEAVEQVVLLAGEGVEEKQDPGMPLGQRISEGGLGLAKGSGALPFS